MGPRSVGYRRASKISGGLLRATGALVHELLQEVKEAHLTHGLADDLFYASMLIENEAKETLKNFIKSSKGKADQEDKVLSLQKLYVMNAGGFLAKVEHVKPRVYKKKQSLVIPLEP